MEGMFEGTELMELDIYQEPHNALNNKIVNFDEADIQKSYNQEQRKDNGTIIISSRSRHIGMKLQAQKNTEYPTGFNTTADEDPSITSGLTQEAAEEDDASLLGGASLYIDRTGDDISLLSDDASLTGGYIYPPGDEYLGVSNSTGYTIASNVKQATPIIT